MFAVVCRFVCHRSGRWTCDRLGLQKRACLTGGVARPRGRVLGWKALRIRPEGLRLELCQERCESTVGLFYNGPSILPDPVEVLKLAGGISLIHVNVVHAQSSCIRCAEHKESS